MPNSHPGSLQLPRHPSGETIRAAAHRDNESHHRRRSRKPNAPPSPELTSARQNDLPLYHPHLTTNAKAVRDFQQTSYATQPSQSISRLPQRRLLSSLPTDL